jgi:hypothetical protein
MKGSIHLIIGADSVFNFGAYVRRDAYNYYPSGNPLADLGPIQSQSISQARTLTMPAYVWTIHM